MPSYSISALTFGCCFFLALFVFEDAPSSDAALLVSLFIYCIDRRLDGRVSSVLGTIV